MASVPSSERAVTCARSGARRGVRRRDFSGFRRGTHRRFRTREASTKVVYFFSHSRERRTRETGDARFISSFISEQSLDATLERGIFRLFERANGVWRGVARHERAGGVIAELVGRKRRFHGDAGELGAR